MRRPDPEQIEDALVRAVAFGLEHDLIDEEALKITTRLLAARLAERAPGRSVELRVPPYVAVACVAGPRHTRGTPPNVVETDPATWVLLASGRYRWEDALDSGRLSASGIRADLSGYLPLIG
ncbi:MAG: sterol carrier family protein [Mycobacteriales bacterium]